MATFQQVSSFRVFVPEKSGWLKYSQSWAEQNTWLCNFDSQDGKVHKTVLLSTLQAQDIWERFRSSECCETTLYS